MSSLTDYLLKEYLQQRSDTMNQQQQLMTEDRQFQMRQQELGHQVMAEATKNYIQLQASEALKTKQKETETQSVAKNAQLAGVNLSTVDINNPTQVGALEGQAQQAVTSAKQAAIDDRQKSKLETAYQNIDDLLETRHGYKMDEIKQTAQTPPKIPGRTPAQADIEQSRMSESAAALFDKKFAGEYAILHNTLNDKNISPSKKRKAAVLLKYMDTQRQKIQNNKTANEVIKDTDPIAAEKTYDNAINNALQTDPSDTFNGQ